MTGPRLVCVAIGASLVFTGACGLDEEGGLAPDGGAAASGGQAGTLGGSSGSTAAGGGAGAGGSGGGAGTGANGGGAGVAGASGAAGSTSSGGAAGASGGAAGAGGASGAAGAAGVAGAGGTGGVTIPSCDDLYGQVTGVNQICGNPAPAAGECRLAVDTDDGDLDAGQTCEDICEDAGGECLGTFDQGVDNCTADTNENIGCQNSDQSNAVCFCSQGCGGGPPCTGGVSCEQGQCVP